MKALVGVMCVAGLLACGGTKTGADSGEAGGGGEGAVGATSTAGGSDVTGPGGAEAGGSGAASPPAQGAAIFQIGPSATPPVGKMCPSASFTAAIPEAPITEQLTGSTYQHNVIDGEAGATVSCRVAQDGAWVFAGEIWLSGRALKIEDGSLSQERTGTAMITVSDSSRLSPATLASSQPCEVSAMQQGASNLQIQAGAMWASFHCAAVESPPSSSCSAKGYFVLENCEQQ